MYPAPHEVAQQFTAMGFPCPSFLTDISDPNHVPPHVVASELFVVVHKLQNTIKQLKNERKEEEEKEEEKKTDETQHNEAYENPVVVTVSKD